MKLNNFNKRKAVFPPTSKEMGFQTEIPMIAILIDLVVFGLNVVFFITIKEYKQALCKLREKIRHIEGELLSQNTAIQIIQNKMNKTEKDL